MIPWQSIDLEQFNLVPKAAFPLLRKIGEGWGTFRIIPVESGRGCPYGCEFSTVTGFFGDSIRFRSNESVVNELLPLKKRARKEKCGAEPADDFQAEKRSPLRPPIAAAPES